jgi:hypothetical protein
MILETEVEKIRTARKRILQKLGNDPQRLLEHYRRLSDELRRSGGFRFVDESAKPGEPASSTPS